MNIEALNDQVLDDTPIGTLRVVLWFGEAAVCIANEHDREKPGRVVHILKPGENPLSAVYGKRVFEHARTVQAYRDVVEARENSEARASETMRGDLRREVKRFLGRYEDARDALGLRFTRPGR